MAQHSNVLIIGGGIIGLAIALELRSRGATVTVLTRSLQETATRAAAGMLAPHAEQLPPGPLRDLGLKSLTLYPGWIRHIEALSQQSAGYWPSGILAPTYGTPSLVSQEEHQAQVQWLDREALHQIQPGLGEGLSGGWWYPDDGQVDPRTLLDGLWKAAEAAGVRLQAGVNVSAIQQSQGCVTGVWTDTETWQADHYVLATGAWSADLLPIPVSPLKGQMLSLFAAAPSLPAAQPLRRVLYGDEVYIVPRQDGRRIVIGATVEPVGFAAYNTPAGLESLLSAAIRLYPGLGDRPIEEFWWGFRPATPDEEPILGPGPCENFTLATGHHRNGILLAPATALLIADWIWNQASSQLLDAFSYKRFHQPLSVNPSPASITVTSPPSDMSSTESLDLGLSSAATPAVFPTANIPGSPSEAELLAADSPLVIAGRTFRSRLMTGTGKYRTFDQMRESVVASGCEIVTVAVRRVQTQAPGHEGLAEALDWSKVWMLPNTAGCKTAEEAIRVARLGREMAKLLGQEDNNFVKLEVIPDATYLLPDPIGTLQAAEQLVKEGFAVLPYINADPLLAKYLEEAGCATVMPLGSPIGSGQGIRNAANIQIIIENARVPVVVDAGIGTPSEAAQAMEMGASALLINTAIAQAQYPARMALAMKLATEAGRLAYLAGRIPIKGSASPSSPTTGTVTG